MRFFVQLQVQHIARDSNANQVSDLCDLFSCVDPVAFFHSCCFLDLSVTREELAVIDLQSKGFAIKRVGPRVTVPSAIA